MSQSKIGVVSQITTEAFSTVTEEEMTSENTDKVVPIDRMKEISLLLKIMNLWGLYLNRNAKCKLWGVIVMIIVHFLVALSFCHAVYFATTGEAIVFKITSFIVFLGQFMVLVSYHNFKRHNFKINKILQNLPVSYGTGVRYRSCKRPILFRILAIFANGILFYIYSAWFITLPDYKPLFDRFGCGTIINNNSYIKSEYFAAAIQLLIITFVDMPFTVFFLYYSSICRILQHDIECFKKMAVNSVHCMPDIFNTYNRIWNATKETNDIFSKMLNWWMLVVILQGIFYGSVGLKMILTNDEKFWGVYFLVVILFVTISFVDAMLSASCIPLEAGDISSYITGVMVSNCPETSRFAMTLYLKNTLQPPQMTVGESMNINGSLLFTVFGTIATYFVVVLQMNY